MSEEEGNLNNGSAEPTKAGEVSVTGPGISITRPVDEATMSDVIALLFGAAGSVEDRRHSRTMRPRNLNPRHEVATNQFAPAVRHDLRLGTATGTMAWAGFRGVSVAPTEIVQETK